MNDILLPTLLFWENGNSFYGSKGLARFFIQPVKREPPEEDPEGQARTELAVELWKGPLTKALSDILDTAVFPLSEEGRPSPPATGRPGPAPDGEAVRGDRRQRPPS